MKIAMYTEPLPPAFRWDPKAPWRGTEKFYVETASSLAKTGHDVTVYLDSDAEAARAGARYVPRTAYRGGYDAVLCCNTQPPAREPGTRYVYWSNLWGDRYERHLWADAQIVISEFARRAYAPPPDAPCFVVGHGVDADKYRCDGPKERLALFSSSMDRGGVWLQANWERFDTGLELVCSAGRMSEADLVETYRRAAVWLHPGMGVELFCLSALEAQAAGCLCVYGPVMALPETIGSGHLALPAYMWAKDLGPILRATVLKAVQPPALPTWDGVTARIEAVLRNADPGLDVFSERIRTMKGGER